MVSWGILRYTGSYPEGTPRIPMGHQALKVESAFSANMWHNRTNLARHIRCKECEQKKEASVHKCDACQALFLGPWGPKGHRHPLETSVSPDYLGSYLVGITGALEGIPRVSWGILRYTGSYPGGNPR